MAYAAAAHERGLEVLIAGAGGAAALPGVVAAKTPLPVIGVPLEGWALQGMDALLSMVQMPAGVPVATVSIGRPGAVNAAPVRRPHPRPQPPGDPRPAAPLPGGARARHPRRARSALGPLIPHERDQR